jgi:ABC-type siderophore export system fused ATPase/permease subunit
MSTAQIISEQYKVLPKRVQKELKALINSEDENQPLLAKIEQGLKEVKLIREGKLPRRTFADLQRDINNGQ